MEKKPPHLKLVLAEAASSPDREAVKTAIRSHLESAGVIGTFNHLLKAGFTIVYSEPEEPGLKVTITKDTAKKNQPLSFTLIFTEDERRGLNQPVIRCSCDDTLGEKRLAQIMDIYGELEKWSFRNLPRITIASGERDTAPTLFPFNP